MGVQIRGLLLFALPCLMYAANLEDAARDLARRVNDSLGPRETVALYTRALDPSGESAVLERTLNRTLSARLRPPASTSLTVTVSENVRGPLLVGELLRGEAASIFLAPYDDAPPALRTTQLALTLEARLVWEQREPVLDLALAGRQIAGQQMIVLEPGRIAVYARQDEVWKLRQAASPPPGATSRDVRGRLVIEDKLVRAWLPGALCTFSLEGDIALRCDSRTGDWPIAGGTALRLPASLVQHRNYFSAPPLPPFFTAAPWNDRWIVATTAGHTRIFDTNGQAVATLGNWGTEIAMIDSSCGSRYLLAQRQTNSLEALTIDRDNRAAPAAAPVALDGRLAALWPSESGSAIAIVQSSTQSTYAAYRVTLSCGR
jgi:hypothetical protein